MDKEVKLRSILFFVIGFLLILSLIICIYIVAGERDLVPVEATIMDVTKDSPKTGINTLSIKYEVNGSDYDFLLETKKDYNIGEVINVYYHSKDVTQVKYYKTSKMIFLCPIIGLVLCALGLFELFRKNDDLGDFKTSVIGVIGNTQQLKIVTENTPEQAYTPTEEEQQEVEVKQINTAVEEELPAPMAEEPVPVVEVPAADVAVATPVQEEIPAMPAETVVETSPVEPVPAEPAPAPAEAAPVEEPAPEAPAPVEEPPVELPKEEEKKPEMVSVDDANNASLEENIAKKVKEKSGDKIEVTEDELKEAIKDVLADVIKEAKQESKPKEVVQSRVIPNYYYISGTSLMYEEAGKAQKELSLKDIKNVTRTINSEGNVVKLIVESDEVKCILTNMKNIDLEQLSNLLRNKMRAMDENFEEVIEHKEY